MLNLRVIGIFPKRQPRIVFPLGQGPIQLKNYISSVGPQISINNPSRVGTGYVDQCKLWEVRKSEAMLCRHWNELAKFSFQYLILKWITSNTWAKNGILIKNLFPLVLISSISNWLFGSASEVPELCYGSACRPTFEKWLKRKKEYSDPDGKNSRQKWQRVILRKQRILDFLGLKPS